MTSEDLAQTVIGVTELGHDRSQGTHLFHAQCLGELHVLLINLEQVVLQEPSHRRAGRILVAAELEHLVEEQGRIEIHSRQLRDLVDRLVYRIQVQQNQRLP